MRCDKHYPIHRERVDGLVGEIYVTPHDSRHPVKLGLGELGGVQAGIWLTPAEALALADLLQARPGS